ncbi:gluconate 2-dehydrogenase subunit 3 family protein [Colwellia demingiae]|uniref:Gluconate 2-dehydrogenase subunit 3 family protein n=1 Tax=Colwellia demingiae TaxID=89401 RepID=A0A5C6QC97_9GAMM|nr:gluconate 2-dehydrogenase subunit 3 family protein [Colwellia demingiae]TWX66232.1 gluconate 2-dehydrogenase subunit 3 family protein [Colwellia demingiae]
MINEDKCTSFFDKNYQTPEFIKNKKRQAQQNRRHFLKSAAGMGALASLPAFSVSAKAQTSLNELLNTLVKTDPWLTLDATLNQLLPSSPTGPSASEIRATAYLYQVMTVQPTEQDEKDFILKGVGWLNGYANSEKSANFAQLSFADKEQLLRGISQSTAGQNWLNTLLGYIFQAMLSPASYGGNPDGIGWAWLEHQAGFPLPEKGQRYFELPSRARIDLISRVNYDAKRLASSRNKSHQGTKKS